MKLLIHLFMEVFEKKNYTLFLSKCLFYSRFAWLISPINSATSILQYPHKKFKSLNISSYLIFCLSLSLFMNIVAI